MTTLVDLITRLITQLGISLPTGWQSLTDNEIAQRFLKEVNEYFYQTFPGIGLTDVDGESFSYFSEFHKFWQKHHREILNPQINNAQVKKAAEALNKAV